jgi:hypothetical protein
LGLRLRNDDWWLEINLGRGADDSGIGSLVFTEYHGSSGDDPLNTHLAGTTTHEIGYLFGTGRADDGQQYVIVPKEVYNGDRDSDRTPERVILELDPVREWSVMISGWNSELNDQPMGGRYIAVSIEELSTLEFDDVDSREED